MTGYKRYLVIFIFALICIGTVMKQSYAMSITEAVERYCYKYKIDKRIIYALIQVESTGDHTAVSHKGAAGLLQVMPARARAYYRYRYEYEEALWALPLSKLSDFAMRQHLRLTGAAIGSGVWSLRQEIDRCDGNIIKALNRYNRGNASGVSWKFIHDVMDEMIRFDNRE